MNPAIPLTLAALFTATPPRALDRGDTVGLAAAAERMALPALKGPLSVKAEPLFARVELRAPRDAAALAAHLRKLTGTLCPEVEQGEDRVWLHCRTGRLQAELRRAGGRELLDLRELRGLPASPPEDALPAFTCDPSLFELGDRCPGKSPVARAECLYAQGKLAEARALYESALASPQRAFAEVRLGDFALASGNLKAAWRHYQNVAPVGIPGRLVLARLCELTGDCLSLPGFGSAFDAVGLPEPLRTEIELRQVRAAALTGDYETAARLLADRLSDPLRAPACERAGLFCRRLTLAALEKSGGGGSAALELYLAIPGRQRGPLADRMARAAADLAARMGAPLFAAHLLAAATGEVPARELSDHLCRAAELFLEAGEKVRARVVFDFARTRLKRSELASARWTQVAAGLAPAGSQAPAASPTAAAEDLRKDLARAEQTLAQARSLLKEP